MAFVVQRIVERIPLITASTPLEQIEIEFERQGILYSGQFRVFEAGSPAAMVEVPVEVLRYDAATQTWEPGHWIHEDQFDDLAMAVKVALLH